MRRDSIICKLSPKRCGERSFRLARTCNRGAGVELKVRERAEATSRIVLMTHPAKATSIPSRPALAIGLQALTSTGLQYMYHLG